MRVSLLHARGIPYEDNGKDPTATHCGIRRYRTLFLQGSGTYIKAPRIFSSHTSHFFHSVLWPLPSGGGYRPVHHSPVVFPTRRWPNIPTSLHFHSLLYIGERDFIEIKSSCRIRIDELNSCHTYNPLIWYMFVTPPSSLHLFALLIIVQRRSPSLIDKPLVISIFL
jgi:hypothetical protein